MGAESDNKTEGLVLRLAGRWNNTFLSLPAVDDRMRPSAVSEAATICIIMYANDIVHTARTAKVGKESEPIPTIFLTTRKMIASMCAQSDLLCVFTKYVFMFIFAVKIRWWSLPSV